MRAMGQCVAEAVDREKWVFRDVDDALEREGSLTPPPPACGHTTLGHSAEWPWTLKPPSPKEKPCWDFVHQVHLNVGALLGVDTSACQLLAAVKVYGLSGLYEATKNIRGDGSIGGDRASICAIKSQHLWKLIPSMVL